MLTTLVLILVVTIGVAGEGEEMVVGRTTDFHTSLIAPSGHAFSGLQIAARRERPCHVRTYFHQASPATAQYCTRRFTRRQLRGGEVALVAPGEQVNGIAACFTQGDRVGAIRLYTFAGEAPTAKVGDCVTEYRTVWCQREWTLQGLQLYFDRAPDHPGEASLVGLRPLCIGPA